MAASLNRRPLSITIQPPCYAGMVQQSVVDSQRKLREQLVVTSLAKAKIKL